MRLLLFTEKSDLMQNKKDQHYVPRFYLENFSKNKKPWYAQKIRFQGSRACVN